MCVVVVSLYVGNQRSRTLLVYLSDVDVANGIEAGGETEFLHAKPAALRVRARKVRGLRNRRL